MDDTDAQKQPYWPELEELARPAREHRRLAPERRGEIIINLCRRAPLSVKDLSILLDRSEAYIGDAIRPLVTAGELTFLYPDQPRHPRQKYMAASEVVIDLGQEDELDLEAPESYLAPPIKPDRRETQTRPPAPRPQQTIRQSGRASDAHGEGSRFPNPAVNLAYALLAGIALGWTNPLIWWAFALGAAFLLSIWHMAVDSQQFRRFSSLETLPPAGAFLVLKSAVTFAEILLVYFVIRAIVDR